MYSIPFLDLPPLLRAGGRVRLPGSKSISNRVLLLAGLAAGATHVHALLDSDDTRVMLDALTALGCDVQPIADGVRIQGLGGRLRAREAELFLGNAGTAMRPLTAVLALLSALQGGQFEVSGVPRMHERPIGDLVDALRRIGCHIDELGTAGYPPLRLGSGAPLPLDASRPIRVRGDVSSQFLTALLLALPLLTEERPISVEVEGELISKPYVEITLKLLARFGIDVQNHELQRFVIPQGSVYRPPGEIHVEGDASSASYFIALGAIAGIDAPVHIEGIDRQSIQGDVAFADAAAAMGARIESGPGWVSAQRGRWPLAAIDLDCNAIPDAAMTLAMMALYADGRTRLRGIGSWRVKETDRIAAMATELRKLGATVEEGADWIAITPPVRWQSAVLDTYDDHRMAMCASLAAFNGLAGAQPPLPQRVRDPRCVGKTFPEYFETFFKLCGTEARHVPVLTIDGPTASGKGTLASELARRLGYRLLDSGALYRATALVALQRGIAADDEATLSAIAATLPLRFDAGRTWMGDDEVTAALRREEVGAMASRISALPGVRAALLDLQYGFRSPPGLVADGRDMGTAIFPGADLKVYLSASAAERAKRRHLQLLGNGISSNIDSLSADLAARDARDQNRSVSPLKPAEDALLLDNSGLSVEASVDRVLSWWQERRPFGRDESS